MPGLWHAAIRTSGLSRHGRHAPFPLAVSDTAQINCLVEKCKSVRHETLSQFCSYADLMSWPACTPRDAMSSAD